MRRSAVPTVGLAAALAATACSESPTQVPSKDLSPPSTIAASVTSSGGVDFSHELGDIHTRYLPSFDDQQAAAQLQTEMDAIAERLAAGDTEGARAALGRARALLTPGVANPADLYALTRTFDVIEGSLP